jgi:hypothetical protein
MARKIRLPFQVSPSFKKMIEEIQKEIRKQTGENISHYDIADYVMNEADINKIEQRLLSKKNNFDIKIKFDGRF